MLFNLLENEKYLAINHSIGVDVIQYAKILAQDFIKYKKDTYIISFKQPENKTQLLKILPYDSSDILSIKNSIIIFDSVNIQDSLIEHSEILKILEKFNYIIYLFTFGVSQDSMRRLTNLLKNIKILNDNIGNLGYAIKEEAIFSKMTLAQNNNYFELIIEEPKESDYPLSQQICNISYPEKYRNLINEQPDHYLNNYDDLPDEYLVESLIDDIGPSILDNAPKLKDLLLIINNNKNTNHIIFTKYNYFYGAKLIEALIKKYIGINPFVILPEIKPESARPQTNDEKLAFEKMKNNNFENVMHRFNKNVKTNNFNILITTETFNNILPKNISHLHMLDGSLQKTMQLIDEIYKYINYNINADSNPPKFILHNYICKAIQELSADEIGYKKFITKYNNNERYYDSLSEIFVGSISINDSKLIVTSS